MSIQKKELDPVDGLETKYPVMTSEFKRLQVEQYELFCRKQIDYGPGNIALGTTLATKEDIMMSLTGLIVRMNDKVQRLLNLLVKNNNAKPENESAMDAFMDTSVYGIIARIVSAEKWAK